MDSTAVKSAIAEISPQLRELGVRSLSLFGSVARGEAQETSDLDMLVEFEGRATFSGYMDVKELLEQTLGRRVDLVTRRAVKPALRDRILGEAIRVA